MRTVRLFSRFFIYIALSLAVTLCARAQSPELGADARRQPLSFTENRGQIIDTKGSPRPEISFTSDAPGVQLFFTGHGISYVFRERDTLLSSTTLPIGRKTSLSAPERSRSLKGYRVDMELLGARSGVRPVGEDAVAVSSNYYLAGSSDGIRNVRSYRTLVYHDIYPKIDLVFRSGAEGIKYDFIVAPGGRVSDIALGYIAAAKVELTGTGTLRVATPLGTIEEGKPYSYQREGASTEQARLHEGGTSVPSGYALRDGVIRFEIGAYDSSRTLVIDPGIVWSTYFGGSDFEIANAVTVDRDGNVYVTGNTTSKDYPVTPGAFQGGYQGGSVTFDDGVVLKLDRDGQRIWATYFGGEGDEDAQGIAVDTAGNVVVTGGTDSRAFPITPNAVQGTLDSADAFVAKFDRSGGLLWSTYYGGSSKDRAHAVAIDSGNNVVIVGETASPDLRTGSNVAQSVFGGKPSTTQDIFVAKFAPDGRWLWGTFFGGNSDDQAFAVAIDREGNIWAGGQTGPGTFPVTPDALQPAVIGPKDIALVKLDRDGGLRWATVYGGDNRERVNGISLTEAGEPVIAGWTLSITFPTTPGGVQENHAGNPGRYDAFILKLDTAGRRQWSTYYGGFGDEEALAVACDWLTDAILVTGYTGSDDFPLPPGGVPGKRAGITDAFTLRFDYTGRPVWGALLGGAQGLTKANGIAVDPDAGIVIAGYTTSPNFPTQNAIQPALNGFDDLFVTRYACSITAPILITGDTAACTSVPAVLKAPPGYDFYRWSNGSSSSSVSITVPGLYSVTVADSAGCSGRSQPFLVRPAVSVGIIPADSVKFLCSGDSTQLGAPLGFASYLWSNGATTPTTFVSAAGSYSVTVIDSAGCGGTSRPILVSFYPQPSPPTILQCGLTLTASPGTSYQWRQDSIVIPGERSRVFVAPGLGVYSVTVTDTNGCRATSLPFVLSDETTATSAVSLPDTIQAVPADLVALPVILDSARGLPAEPQRFTIALRFDRTLLFPIDSDAVMSVAPNGDRIVEYERLWPGSGDTLTILRFTAMLGDSDMTPLEIESFVWRSECPVQVARSGGVLMLSICREGGDRLLQITDGMSLKPVQPNPAGDIAEIEYELIESGRSALYLTDMTGRRVLTVFEGEVRPGTYRRRVDLSMLSSGLYLYVLQTPTQRTSRSIMVKR